MTLATGRVVSSTSTSNARQTCVEQVYNKDVVQMRSSFNVHILEMYTSSTAQGGGGSFKNRKPIGEVGGCESGMAERSH